MTSADIFRKWKRNAQIENVLLFNSDALRYDSLSRSVAQRGVTFKTVASSLFTAASFPSIITGLYPHHHGVYSFFDRLPKDMPSLLNLPGYNASFYTENTWLNFEPGSSPIHKALRSKHSIPLKKLEPPFIYLEDEKGGHCPYGYGWSKDDVYKEDDCKKFFRDYGRKRGEELRKRYRLGIDRSIREFEKRMKILEERKLIDRTLIVFLSDHGELLGEYGGIIGHGNLTAPELVYVPTVFIHPGLPRGESFENEGVLRHVDLFPTILDLLNVDPERKVDGISLFKAIKLPEFGYTYYKTGAKRRIWKFSMNFTIEEKSIWDKNGGYLFREGANLVHRLFVTMYHTMVSNSSIQSIYLKGRLRQTPFHTTINYGRIFKAFGTSFMKYSYPSFDFKEAQELIKQIDRPETKPSKKNRINSKIDKLRRQGKI